MTWSLTTPVTGGAQTGFTAPTYTVALDKAPDVNGTQYAVTALGGTQAGVTTHSMSSPFFVSFWRPKTFKSVGKTNPVTGLLPSVAYNVFKQVVQKGMIPLAGQPVKPSSISTVFSVLAGADTADAANVRAMVSFDVGVRSQTSSGLGDTLVSGLV
jgi:hypothetical protein